MMINAPDHTLTARRFVPGHAAGQTTGLIESLLKHVQVFMCGLHGHDSVMQYERTRMFLRCTSCGHETPGWDVVPSELVRVRPEPRPARAPEFQVVRKIA